MCNLSYKSITHIIANVCSMLYQNQLTIIHNTADVGPTLDKHYSLMKKVVCQTGDVAKYISMISYPKYFVSYCFVCRFDFSSVRKSVIFRTHRKNVCGFNKVCVFSCKFVNLMLETFQIHIIKLKCYAKQ